MQPAINIKGSMAAIGYSYEYCGGAATFIKVPPIVMEKDCLLPFDENSEFFEASLAEPMSCIMEHSILCTTVNVVFMSIRWEL